MKASGIAGLLFGFGLIVLSIFYDPSISSASGRVNNLGLLNERLVFAILGGSLIVMGATLLAASKIIVAVEAMSHHQHTATVANGEAIRSQLSPPPSFARADRQSVAPPYRSDAQTPAPKISVVDWEDIEIAAIQQGWSTSLGPGGMRIRRDDGTIRTFPTPDLGRQFFRLPAK